MCLTVIVVMTVVFHKPSISIHKWNNGRPVSSRLRKRHFLLAVCSTHVFLCVCCLAHVAWDKRLHKNGFWVSSFFFFLYSLSVFFLRFVFLIDFFFLFYFFLFFLIFHIIHAFFHFSLLLFYDFHYFLYSLYFSFTLHVTEFSSASFSLFLSSASCSS